MLHGLSGPHRREIDPIFALTFLDEKCEDCSTIPLTMLTVTCRGFAFQNLKTDIFSFS